VTRLARLAATLAEPLLVTNPTNVAYLTGFHSTNPALLVEPGGRARLFSDFRYAETGRAVPDVEFELTARNLYADLAERLRGRMGFEADVVTYARWEQLGSRGLELVPRRGLVEALRAVKDEPELDAIRRAAAITSEGYARLAEERFVGRSERELARRLEEHFRDLGADGLAFPVIVASGAMAARPHYQPSDREVRAGQTVIVDAGAVVDGYCADCTRTFATGPLPERLRAAYELCLEAQLAALEAVRPGVTGVAADAAARDRIAARGLADAFGHGLGHGVGLDIHEAPTLSQESADTVVSGNVVTVEPGIYLEGLGGVRIEDLVVVREGGVEILTPFTKDLIATSPG
jgi:Xaa-Pro aminopeptidase